MNDFTKKELKIIRMLINSTDEKVLTESDEIIMVQSKIQSMIENYCEHELSGPGYCPGLYNKVIEGKEITAKDLVRIYECNKCGVIVNDVD